MIFSEWAFGKASVLNERIMLIYVLLRFSPSESVHESENTSPSLRQSNQSSNPTASQSPYTAP